MPPASITTAPLPVDEALPADEGRGLVGLDEHWRAAAELSDGDCVRVVGRRVTVARVATRTVPSETPCARLDAATRENAGVDLGARVHLERVDPAPAEEVVLRPASSRPRPNDLPYLAGQLDGRALVAGDRLRTDLYGSRSIELKVLRTVPEGPVLVHAATSILFDAENEGPATVTWEQIGGLEPQVQRLREMIELPLRSPQVFERLGIGAPKGVLLHGPPGCGKTLIARAVAHECEVAFFPVSGPEIVHKFYGESEAHLRTLFDQAAQAAPSILFLDEIDAIAPRRDRTPGEAEKRLVAQLLAVMDGLARREQVVVIGATNLPDALDPALRRPGRFDREIAIPIPDRVGRREILGIHSRSMPLAEDVDLDDLAEITHGFVGADLEALCREAAMARLRRLGVGQYPGAPYDEDEIRDLLVEDTDFRVALREVQPSALREVAIEVPEVPWEAVGGLGSIRERLQTLFVWPLRHAALFDAARIRSARGVLLHGPPGCGKTLIARALATESGVNFLAVKGPELLAMHVGESEGKVREIFRKARQAAPAILFFDEVDALLPRREGSSGSDVPERVLGQFLAELDGIEELRDVLVLAATNRLDRVDPALLRPGRFDELLEIPLPDAAARRTIFEIHLGARAEEAGLDLDDLSARTAGQSGAIVGEICRQSMLRAIGRVLSDAGDETADPESLQLTSSDVEAALVQVLREHQPGSTTATGAAARRESSSTSTTAADSEPDGR